MKKLLLGASMTLIGLQQANAQVWTQNFNAATIPANWAMINDGKLPNTSFNANFQAKLTANAWAPFTRAAGDSAMITTSYFSPVGKADRWLITQSFQVTSANMVLYWEDFAADASYPDSMQIWMSPTAGTTAASFTQKMYDKSGGTSGFVKHGVSLAAYNGQTIRMAFRNNSIDEYVLELDNAGTEIMANAIDGAVDSVIFPTLAVAGSTLKAIVRNAGAQDITSVTLNYQIDGGTAVSQTFTGLSISPYGSQILTFTTPPAVGAAGTHNVTVNLTQTNGAADAVTSNNSKTRAYAVPTGSVARAGLLEEFTSSTCAPCASFNVTFDPLINNSTNNANVPASNFNVIKYQMNWPSPGNDASYNPAGSARRAYYGVNSIPDHFTNGMPGGNGDQAEIAASKTAPAYVTISGTYTVKADSVIATVVVTPNFTTTGANTYLRMAAVEKYYINNAATTSQKNYYHVMRMMLPDANGTKISNWTSGVPQTFTYKAKYTIGGVAQGNYNFWGSAVNSNLVAFIQDDNSKEVYQSKSIPSTNATSVGTITSVETHRIVPNPASDMATVELSLTQPSSISVLVTDVTGRIIMNIPARAMSTGANEVSIPLANIAAGLYNVIITSAEGQVVERLSVVK